MCLFCLFIVAFIVFLTVVMFFSSFSDQAGTMTPFHPFPQPPSTAGPHTVSVGDTDGVHPSGDGTSTTTPAAPTPVPPQGKKGKGGGRGGHTAASQYFLQQQQRERAIHLSQQKVCHTHTLYGDDHCIDTIYICSHYRRIKHVVQNNGIVP